MKREEGMAKSHASRLEAAARSNASRLAAEKAEALGKASPAQLEALANYRRVLSETLGLTAPNTIMATPVIRRAQYDEMNASQTGLGNIDLEKRPVYLDLNGSIQPWSEMYLKQQGNSQ